MNHKFLLLLAGLLWLGGAVAQLIFRHGFEGDFIFSAGFESLLACQDTGDNDNDGLLNCHETNTLIYVSPTDTGTDPNDPDTDGDALSDGDEVLGTAGGLDLPAMGVNPLVQNILIEYDWFDDNLDAGTCAAHSHRPRENAMNLVALAFLNAPNSNPDGSTGIVIIQDYGQGGVFDQGNLINDADGVLTGGVSGAEFLAHKASHFPSNRDGYFHYTILPHRYNTNSGSSGQAELNGDDLIVSLYCFGSDRNVSHTILHELGHNLSYRHGGNTSCNYKPNYNSVMNYQFQFPGADDDCDGAGDGVLDYSRGLNAPLNENQLIEADGICNSQAIDWNDNAVIDGAPVSVDINSDGGNSSCGGVLTTLSDHDDWAAINFAGILDSDRPDLPVISCHNPAPL
ncbi:hypothetical protein [Marinicella meishanensis]|uniref:hypothetical protein n=1 Tax=Marinicella meishanensis TaxID=2873263 RepID=UPI001CBF72AC|nr:hypothetical protein [Marinicella sp. NBU2979]